MLRLICYRILQTVRDVPMMFWGLAFPLAMAAMFALSFGRGADAEVMESIPTALVEEQEGGYFSEFCQALDGKTLKLEKTDREKALELLEKGQVAGVYYGGETPSLTVAGTGLKESILEMLLDAYRKKEELIRRIAAARPQGLPAAAERMAEEVSMTRTEDSGVGDLSYDVMYYFALLAMTCLSGAYLGVQSSEDSQANLSALGARRSICPTPRLKMILSEFISMVLIQFTNIMLVTGFIQWVLKVPLGKNLPGLLGVNLMGSMIGVSLGIAVGSLLRAGQGIKMGVTVGVILGFSFLAGLMTGNMKDILEHTCPMVNRLNPAAVLSDAYYCLGVYPDSGRLGRSMTILGLMTGILFLAAFLGIRRERYESI